MSVDIRQGDCLEVMADMADNSIDAIVTDPPYGLGFMGKAWDALPPGEEWARECLRVLKPGGHLLAFGGSRTWHRLAVAVEDAGFEIRDSIAWLYGSGFPKSLDVSKAIDKRAKVNEETKRRIALVAEVIRAHREAKGMERAAVSLAVVGTPSGACWNWEHHQLPSVEMWPAIKRTLDIPDKFDGLIEGDRAQFVAAEREVIGSRTVNGAEGSAGGYADGIASQRGLGGVVREIDITAPATPDAQQWQGWGTALKPAFEPVVVARKPLAGTVAANVLEHGTGALNIDGCRIGADGGTKAVNFGAAAGTMYGGGKGKPRNEIAALEGLGRWPANVVLDESQAAELDRQSGTSRSSVRAPTGRDERGAPNTESGAVIRRADTQQRGHADSGGASRFFYTVKEQDECATAMESAHQTTGTGAHGARHAGSTTANSVGHAAGSGDTTTDPRFFYVAKAPKKERPTYETDDGRKVAHPTVKPLALIRWLVRLVTPPGGVVLDPFAGSGTTVEAAILEGVDVVAIEREADYLPLIEARVRRALDTPRQGTLD